MTSPRTYLFVPATRMERVERAWASGTDAVIVDLEDSVGSADKPRALEQLVSAALARPVHVRINAAGTSTHDDELAAIAGLPGLAGVVVPMVEAADDVAAVARALPPGLEVVALVETPLAIRRLDDILAAPGLGRVAFGSTDYCAALGVVRSADVLAHPRSVLAVAASAAGLPTPVDGPYLHLDDDAGLRRDALDAQALGLRSKLCVHPRQVAVIKEVLRPSPADVGQARELVAAAEQHGGGVFRWQGAMVDAPVLAAARAVLAEAAEAGE